MTGRTVWLASYPKSGNTWLRAVYSALVQGGAVDINWLHGGPQAADAEVFERVLGVPVHLLSRSEIEMLRPRVDEVIDRQSGELRFRKIHDALHPGPAGELIVSVPATRAAIYMVRDPRDLAVSFAHHQKRPMTEASRLVAGEWIVGSGEQSAPQDRPWQGLGASTLAQYRGSWSEHVVSWIDEAPFPVHTTRYEDCVDDPVAAFGAAFRAVGLTFDEGQLQAAVEAASFEKLSAQEDASPFYERVGESPFFRRGQVGDWRHELPDEQARQIERDHAAVMGRLGYL